MVPGSYAALCRTGRLVVYGFHTNLPVGSGLLSPLAWLKMAWGMVKMPHFDPMALTLDSKVEPEALGPHGRATAEPRTHEAPSAASYASFVRLSRPLSSFARSSSDPPLVLLAVNCALPAAHVIPVRARVQPLVFCG